MGRLNCWVLRACALLAGAGLALGMLAAHFTISEGYVSSYARVNGLAIVLAPTS